MSLIAVGACLVTGVGLLAEFKTGVDPTRIAAQIVAGVGFLGAGAILRLGNNVHCLTTAAMIWLAAAVGMAVGFGYFLLAGFTTFIVLVMLLGLRPIELRFFRNPKNRRRDDPIAMNPVDEATRNRAPSSPTP